MSMTSATGSGSSPCSTLARLSSSARMWSKSERSTRSAMAGTSSALTRPCSRTTARSQMSATWSSPCVTRMIVRPSSWKLADPVHALALERLVADGQHLVDEQDVGVDVHGDGEGEPHVHARRVELHLGVDELADAGEVDDARRSTGRSARG